MLGRSKIDRVIDPIDHVATVACEQRRDVDVAFLQSFVRVELVERSLQLPLRRFVSGHLGAMKTGAQPLHLIIDLTPSRFQGIRQRRVHRTEFFL